MNPVMPVVLAIALAAAGCGSTQTSVRLPPVSDALAPAPGIVSAGRLAPEDIARVREAGIRHVIDLTPDAETPDFDEAAAVHAAGLGYSNLPLRGAVDLTPENVRAFDDMLGRATRPVLVHCASGNRVGAMVALRAAWIEGKPLEEAIEVGKAWGLKGLEADVRARIGAEAGMQD